MCRRGAVRGWNRCEPCGTNSQELESSVAREDGASKNLTLKLSNSAGERGEPASAPATRRVKRLMRILGIEALLPETEPEPPGSKSARTCYAASPSNGPTRSGAPI